MAALDEFMADDAGVEPAPPNDRRASPNQCGQLCYCDVAALQLSLGGYAIVRIVGRDGQVVIEKEIRDTLGVEPGWLEFQQLVEDHVEFSFNSPEHDRSLAGILAPYTDVRIPDEDALREARDRAWEARARERTPSRIRMDERQQAWY